MKRKLAAIGLLMILTVGCAKHVAIHPGAISNVDSYSYDVLIAEQSVLDQAKADLQAGKLPESAKESLNYAGAQYNVALAAWNAYHSGNTKDSSTLDQAISALVGAVGQLQKQLGKQLGGQ